MASGSTSSLLSAVSNNYPPQLKQAYFKKIKIQKPKHWWQEDTISYEYLLCVIEGQQYVKRKHGELTVEESKYLIQFPSGELVEAWSDELFFT